jgi:hypothetical protein
VQAYLQACKAFGISHGRRLRRRVVFNFSSIVQRRERRTMRSITHSLG